MTLSVLSVQPTRLQLKQEARGFQGVHAVQLPENLRCVKSLGQQLLASSWGKQTWQDTGFRVSLSSRPGVHQKVGQKLAHHSWHPCPGAPGWGAKLRRIRSRNNHDPFRASSHMGPAIEEEGAPLTTDVSARTAKRVAVIGSGVSGLAAAKAFLEEGHCHVTVFEQQKELGGLWVNTYETARIQNGKSMYEFSDHPMPAEFPLLPSKDQVKQYLETYARRFNVDQHIEFGTRVVRLRKGAHERADSSWTSCEWILDLEKLGEDGAWRSHKSEGFDFVILCLGNYSEKPHIPVFPEGQGPEVFLGQTIHSASFKDAQSLQAKRVAVIGFGKTALDLAVAVAAAQEESMVPVTLVFRQAKWIIPQKALKAQAASSGPYSRFNELWFAKPGRHWVEHLLHSLGLPLVWLYWAVQQRVISSMLAKLGDGYRPRKPLQSALSCTLAVEPEGFQELVAAGRIVLKEIADWHYTERGLRLDGREQLDVDAVVLCTGYDGPGKLADLLPECERGHLLAHQDGLHLYRGLIHPEVPSVAFLGYNMTFSVVHSSELGGKWLAKLASGSFSLPSKEEMEKDREKWRLFREKSWTLYPERGQCFAPLNLTYYDMLRADLGWPRLLAGSNPLKNLLVPITTREVCEP